jgi:CubicO group peptidase (beta-lactamase class C family)
VIESLVVPYVDVGMFDGVVLVGQGEAVLFERAYGRANSVDETANTVASKFRIASVSKGFTAAAVGLLADRDQLSLDDPLSAFIPEFARGDEISLQQMIEHRSGIVHINSLEWYEDATHEPLAQDELLARIMREPLAYDPGTDQAYSNGAYAVLAIVIERVSGRAYGEFVRAEICEPLGLTRTGHEVSGEVVDALAVGYMPGGRFGERTLAPQIDPSVKLGGGSMYSSGRDLFAWVRVRRSGELLRPETAARLLPGAEETLYDSGRAPGYSAVVVNDPGSDLTLVMLSNNYATLSLEETILEALSSGDVPESPVAGCTRADASEFAGVAGTYRWPQPIGTEIELRDEGGELVYVELFRPDQWVGLAATPDGGILCPLYNCVLRPVLQDGEIVGLEVEAGWARRQIIIDRLQ